MKTKFLIVHPGNYGVFLGSAMGIAFWSNLESAGQDLAGVFEFEIDARRFIASWHKVPDGVEVREVMVDDSAKYATIDQCVAAGMDSWDPFPDGSFGPAKRDMLGILRTTERVLQQLNEYARSGEAKDAQDWARRLGAMFMSLAWASSELGEAIGCTERGDHDRAEIRVKAFSARLLRATATLNDEVWAKWRDGHPPTAGIVTLQRSDGAANDVIAPDDELR